MNHTVTQNTTVTFTGIDGTTYKYWVYPVETDFVAKPGNYCFGSQGSDGRIKPLYFGETENLSERFAGHHKMPCAVQHGINVICAHTSSSSASKRRAEESDLIARYAPPCNG